MLQIFYGLNHVQCGSGRVGFVGNFQSSSSNHNAWYHIQCNSGGLVRAEIFSEDEIEDAPVDEWQMIPDGTQSLRTVTTTLVNPQHGLAGRILPQIRKHQMDKTWTVVELSTGFKDMRQPFGMINQFLLSVGFEDECES